MFYYSLMEEYRSIFSEWPTKILVVKYFKYITESDIVTFFELFGKIIVSKLINRISIYFIIIIFIFNVTMF